MDKTMTLEQVRDVLFAYGEGPQHSGSVYGISDKEYAYFAHTMMQAMPDLVSAIDAHLAYQPAEQPRGEGYDVARHNDWLERNAQPKPEQPRGEAVVNRQDIRQVCRTIDGLKDLLFDANALDAEALALHKAGCDAILRIGELSLESAKPKPEQAVGDGVVPDVFMRLLNVARRVPNFTGRGNEHSCTDVELNDAVESCDEWIVTPRPAVATPIATVASERAELVAKIGDCCMGGDPLCAGGCLAEKAARKNAEREAKAVATPAEVTDEMADAAFDDGEQVAQWLYSKGMRNAAFVVRGQLDVRNSHIRRLEKALTAQCQVRKDTQGVDDSARMKTVAEPYTAEVVAEVVRGEDGENKLSFVIEGGVDALEPGVVLYEIGGLPMPDDGATELYASPSAGAVVPEGWKLVPIEPTEAMIEAYHSVEHVTAKSDEDADDAWAIADYKAMIAAAPEVKS